VIDARVGRPGLLRASWLEASITKGLGQQPPVRHFLVLQ
jgi:hypothetical protein